jgi:hyperosmotically inducible protein
MMSKNTFLWIAGLILAVGCFQGCSQGKNSAGDPYIHVDGKQVDRNVHQASRELKADTRQLGKAIQNGAEKVDEKVGPAAQALLDDASVTARIRAKLLADPEVKSLHIGLDTTDGRVVLNGTVATADQKAEAEKLASHTEGVKAVANLLQVNGEAPPAVPAQ